MNGRDTYRSERVVELELQLQEANDTLDAIRNGEVDAVVVGGPAGQFVYTLENADRPYRVLVEQMKEGAITLNADGLMLYANRSFGDLVERPISELIGSSLFDHVDDTSLLTSMLSIGEPDAAELNLLRATGGPVPVNMSIVELQVGNGAPRMLSCIVTDLSQNYARTAEIAQAHARLAERTIQLETSEARLRTVFDTSFQFQGLLSPDGILLDANSVSLDAIQCKLGDVLGRPYWDTPWFSGTTGMPEKIRALVATVANDGAARTEILVKLPQGGWRSLDFSLRAIRDGSGLVTAIVPEAVDLTDMRRAEEALRQAQKLEAIGQLTGGVAHDFNNLLTVIRGSVDLLQRPSISEEKRRRYIAAIGETADRATRLTSQLLAFARRQTLKPEPFDAHASLENVKGIITSLTGAGIELITDFPEEPCFVLADRSQFDTAIVNMAINARDAMGGQGRISITARPVSGYPAVRNHDPVEGDFVAIAITDTGTGIAAADLDRVFEPFFTTKGVGSGTGLGLSQVIGFAKQSDGEIGIESTLGRGSTFTLYLPRVSAECRIVEPKSESYDMIDGEGLWVLIVEDNDEVGRFATQALNELGYRSLLATSAEEALELLTQSPGRFDIIFSDVIMPGKTGLDLAEELRTAQPEVPIILASGYSEIMAQSGSHGFKLLHKPYSIEQLSRAIRTTLRNSG
jgi:signal transduction histidine kinase/CheY-like chemotaxis protein